MICYLLSDAQEFGDDAIFFACLEPKGANWSSLSQEDLDKEVTIRFLKHKGYWDKKFTENDNGDPITGEQYIEEGLYVEDQLRCTTIKIIET